MKILILSMRSMRGASAPPILRGFASPGNLQRSRQKRRTVASLKRSLRCGHLRQHAAPVQEWSETAGRAGGRQAVWSPGAGGSPRCAPQDGSFSTARARANFFEFHALKPRARTMAGWYESAAPEAATAAPTAQPRQRRGEAHVQRNHKLENFESQ